MASNLSKDVVATAGTVLPFLQRTDGRATGQGVDAMHGQLHYVLGREYKQDVQRTVERRRVFSAFRWTRIRLAGEPSPRGDRGWATLRRHLMLA